MLRIQDQVLWVTGKIDFDNAEQCYQQGLQLIQSHSLPLTVDLSQLTYSSFAALVATDSTRTRVKVSGSA